MEYQKITNLLHNEVVLNASNRLPKFKTKNLVEINDEWIINNVNSQIKFKTTILKSSSCDYSDAYILVKETITVNDTSGAGSAANNTNKTAIFRNCASFTKRISNINNTQVDNAKNIHIVMPMYNLIEYSDNYSKISGSLW